MYQMTLDDIPQEETNIGFKVCRNIGNAIINIGKYGNAINNYESAMSSYPGHENDINALLCYGALGNVEKGSGVLLK